MDCNLCGGQTFKPLARKDGYGIVRCRNCSLVQADVADDIEAIYNRGEYFAKTSTGVTFGTDFLERREVMDEIPLNERTFDLFNAYGAEVGTRSFKGRSVLEIGPSPNGGTMKYLTGLAVVDGLEISSKAADHLRGLGFSMYCGNIGDIKINRQYDMILAYEVVEHLRDPKKAFGAICRLLKPRGKFMFSTGNVGSIKSLVYGRSWSYFLPPQHLYYFDEVTITRSLEAAGFKRNDIEVHKYSLWSKRQAIKMGYPNLRSRLFLRLISNLTSGMTVYATR